MDYLSKNTYFLLRHGQATYNVKNIVASASAEISDNPSRLTERGKEQARGAAEKLADESIDFIYSSPYKRTLETATIVAERLGLDVKTDNRLREVDVGIFDGKTVDEYREYFRERNRLTDAAGGGESLMDVRARVKEFLDELNNRYKGKNILIVSHGDTILMMQSVLRDVESEDILKIPYIETGEFKKLGD